MGADPTAPDATAPDPLRPVPARSPIDIVLAFARYVGAARLVAGVGATALLVVAGVWLLRPPEPPVEASLPFAAPVSPDNGTGQPPAPSSTETTIVVHVAGAVVRPGLVVLSPEARVADAIDAAGGISAEADSEALNLAQRLADGQRVYVPREGEPMPAPVGVGGDVGDGAPLAPVDLNRASGAELERLPGVGPATAEAIISHRERSGPFRSVDDLLDVRGIGPAKLDALRDLVTV